MEKRTGRTGSSERRERPGAASGPSSGAIDAARRKPLPQEKTHAEEFYYLKQMGAKTLVDVALADGEVVRGRVEWYDQHCIKVHRDDGPNLLIYKRYIKHIAKAQDEATGE